MPQLGACSRFSDTLLGSVRAYHRAAETVRWLPESVSHILDKQGLEGLEALPPFTRS